MSRITKKVTTRAPYTSTRYGSKEATNIIAGFESDLIHLWTSKLDRNGKAWSRHQDRARLRAAQRIMDLEDSARDGDAIPSDNSHS